MRNLRGLMRTAGLEQESRRSAEVDHRRPDQERLSRSGSQFEGMYLGCEPHPTTRDSEWSTDDPHPGHFQRDSGDQVVERSGFTYFSPGFRNGLIGRAPLRSLAPNPGHKCAVPFGTELRVDLQTRWFWSIRTPCPASHEASYARSLTFVGICQTKKKTAAICP